MNHTSIVQTMYVAFGQGDAPTILHHLSDTVDWEYGAANSPVPWFQHGQGHDAVKAFFAALTALELQYFTRKVICETANIVIATIDLKVTVKATGKRVTKEDEVHIWHFDETTGKINRFRHRADTLQHFLALQP